MRNVSRFINPVSLTIFVAHVRAVRFHAVLGLVCL